MSGQTSKPDIQKEISQGYLVLMDLYRKARTVNKTDVEILELLNNTITEQKLKCKPITIKELVLFEQAELIRLGQMFEVTNVFDLIKSKSRKMEKLALIEKNLWDIAETKIGAQTKARVYGHLADVVLKEKELEDELVRLLN